MQKALTNFLCVPGVVNVAEVEKHLISVAITLNAGTARGCAIQTCAPITQQGQPHGIAFDGKGIGRNGCGLPWMRLDSLPPSEKTEEPTNEIPFVKLRFLPTGGERSQIPLVSALLRQKTLQQRSSFIVSSQKHVSAGTLVGRFQLLKGIAETRQHHC